jgi:predicted nuclease of restriction endonuclease-like (RecB) superfamily
VKVPDPNARNFYECEALRRGWTVRQLAAQIRAGSYQHTRPPRDAASARRPGAQTAAPPGLPDEMLRDPYLRQFFHVPASGGDGSSRARESLATWLSRAKGAREGGPVWLQ